MTSLEGIQALENLSLADFSGSKLVDVSPLASCTNLVTVNLSSCDQVRDVSSLIGLPSLKRLTVYGTSVPDQTVQELQDRGISTY